MRAVVVQEPMMLIVFSLVVTLAAVIIVLVANRGGREPYPYRYRYERPTYIRRSRVYEMEEPDDGTGVGCTLLPFVIGGVVTLIALARLFS